MRSYRTYNPWGHVSRADRLGRQQQLEHNRAYLRISKEPEWPELHALCKQSAAGEVIDKDRFNELADALNKKGFTDRDIERAL